MSRIDPYGGIVVSSAVAAKVRVQKDRPRRQAQEHSRDPSPEEQNEQKPPEDGKPHVDLKA